MVYVLGLACIAWTLIELARLSRETPALVRPRAARRGGVRAGGCRVPLAAWDDQGRPILVEDVSLRPPR